MAIGSEVEPRDLIAANLLKIDFPAPTGTLGFWDGIWQIDVDGVSYQSVAGEISTIEDKASLEPVGIEISVSGVDPSAIAGLKDFDHQGSPAEVLFGVFDPVTWSFSPPPSVVWSGEVDTMASEIAPGEDGTATATIYIRIENAFRRIFQPTVSRRNDADHQSRFAGDRFYEFVPDLKGPTNWGVRDPVSSTPHGQARKNTDFGSAGALRRR